MTTFLEVASNKRFRFFGNVTLGSVDEQKHSIHCIQNTDSNNNNNDINNTNGNTNNNINQIKESAENIITINDLKKAYNIIILAYGASSDSQLNIEGENLKGVLSARNFVNWYNGHPHYQYVGEQLDMGRIKDVVIIGQGNVALDCAR